MSANRPHPRLSGSLAATFAAAFLLIGAGDASAAQRYASPSGGTGACSQGAPCDIGTAIGLASNGDEVIVTPGTYAQGASELDLFANNLTVRNVPGQPKPLITSTATDAVVTFGLNDTLRGLRISHTGGGNNGLFLADSATAEQMEVTTDGSVACSLFGGALIRDSVCRSSNTFGAGVASQSSGSTMAYARNVTAISTGTNGAGITVDAGVAATVQIEARNVIAQGNFDVEAITEDVTSIADVSLTYSDFVATRAAGPGTSTVSPVGSATNLSVFPVFVDAASGDYHQAPNSPTVNAGATDARTGSFDFEGDARPQGPAIDIGADEVVVPAVADTTAPGTSIDRGPRVKTKKRTAKFAFSSDDPGSSFECSLDHRSFTPCSSVQTYVHLRRRGHSFAVRAIDAAGNADASPATYNWRIKKKHRRH